MNVNINAVRFISVLFKRNSFALFNEVVVDIVAVNVVSARNRFRKIVVRGVFKRAVNALVYAFVVFVICKFIADHNKISFL